MEGNRHERVALLITSYIIGFITAFIAYGLTGVQDGHITKVVSVPPTQTSNQAASVQRAMAPALDLYKDETGFYLSFGDSESVLLSVPLAFVEDEQYTGTDGVHYDIPFFSLSPDESKVYFCEQPTVASERCKPFVYNVKSKTVQPVLDQGQRVLFTIADHAVTWSGGNQLRF